MAMLIMVITQAGVEMMVSTSVMHTHSCSAPMETAMFSTVLLDPVTLVMTGSLMAPATVKVTSVM